MTGSVVDKFRRVARRVRNKLGPRAAVLLYHRISDTPEDPYLLRVRPQNFAQHLEVIRKLARPMPLRRFAAEWRGGRMPHRAVVVTFDDGYADNLLAARPVLERQDVPATVFVTTGPLERRREFWWDELEGVLLSGPLPLTPLELVVSGEVKRWSFADRDASGPRRLAPWRAWQPPPTPREAAFKELWALLQAMRDDERTAVLDRIRAWAGRAGGMRATHDVIAEQDLPALVAGGLIDVGAHTVTHSRLSVLPIDLQRHELEASRRRLEEILHGPIATMSYPFGGKDDYTPGTVALARELGFECACANVAGPVQAGDDPFRLRRCFVPDVDGDRFEEMLQSWFEAA